MQERTGHATATDAAQGSALRALWALFRRLHCAFPVFHSLDTVTQ